MAKKTKVPDEALEKAIKAAGEAKTADELKAAQSLILPALLGASDRTSAKLLGRSRGSVVRMRKLHFSDCFELWRQGPSAFPVFYGSPSARFETSFFFRLHPVKPMAKIKYPELSAAWNEIHKPLFEPW